MVTSIKLFSEYSSHICEFDNFFIIFSFCNTIFNQFTRIDEWRDLLSLHAPSKATRYRQYFKFIRALCVSRYAKRRAWWHEIRWWRNGFFMAEPSHGDTSGTRKLCVELWKRGTQLPWSSGRATLIDLSCQNISQSSRPLTSRYML